MPMPASFACVTGCFFVSICRSEGAVCNGSLPPSLTHSLPPSLPHSLTHSLTHSPSPFSASPPPSPSIYLSETEQITSPGLLPTNFRSSRRCTTVFTGPRSFEASSSPEIFFTTCVNSVNLIKLSLNYIENIGKLEALRQARRRKYSSPPALTVLT
jgi:hypothetical protein